MPSAKKFYVYILCGLFILCAAAVAGTKWYSGYEQKLKQERDAAISEAIQIYENGDYDNAQEIFTRYAQQGDGEAMYYLGNICSNYTQEYAQAVEWYQKAADNGYAAFAYAAIGDMYRTGTADSTLSKEERLTKGFEFYEKAADTGNIKVMMTVGDLYFNARDYKNARRLYQKAADSGEWKAMARLAFSGEKDDKRKWLSETGRGWLEKAAQSGQEPTMKALLASEYTFPPADFQKATEWGEAAVEDGSKYGRLILAQIYSNKEAGQYYDQAKALTNINIFIQEIHQASEEYAEIAVMITPRKDTLSETKQAIYERSLYHIALVYYELEQYQKALEWCKKAETTSQKKEAAFASILIGDMYKNGEGVNKDLTKAMEYYKKAAAKGNVVAMEQIGVMYTNKGEGPRRDFAKAMKWFKKAAELGSSHAMYCVGWLYHFGDKSRGVEQDFDAARKWYNKAIAVDNNANARYGLNRLPAADDEQKQRIINSAKTTRYSDDGDSWGEFAEYNLDKVRWRYIGMDPANFMHGVSMEGYFPNTAGSVSKLQIIFGITWDTKENKFTIKQFSCYINGDWVRTGLPSWISYALGL